MDTVEPIEWLNAILRLASAIILTVAGVFSFIQYRKDALRPKPAWAYFSHVLVVLALWRWVVLATSSPHFSGFTSWLEPFINPISAALYVLAGTSSIVLVIASSRKRGTDA